jgi:hypothetical protein
MTTASDTSAQVEWNRQQPQHLQISLYQVQAGVKARVPGIRRCHDCRNPYIDDQSGLPYCRNCRADHNRNCGQCGTTFRNTTDGAHLCKSCLNQPSLPLF